MDEIMQIESIKFLLSSLKKLTDRFVAMEKRVTLSFKNIATDVDKLLDRIELLEQKIIDLRDGDPLSGRPPRTQEPSVTPETKEHLVPRLNPWKEHGCSCLGREPSSEGPNWKH